MTSPIAACKFEKCDTQARCIGYCLAHYKQHRLGESLRPVRGSNYFWEARLNASGDKQCSRCEYWLPLKEFHDRRDGSRVNQEFGRSHCRRCNILRRMGINARQYDEMLKAQGGGCAICGKTEQVNGRQLSVDHDHSHCSGTSSCSICIRGILCDDCNNVLGRAHDEPKVLEQAAYYLRHNTWHCASELNKFLHGID